MGLDDKMKNKAEDLRQGQGGRRQGDRRREARGRGQGRPDRGRPQAGRREGQGRVQELTPTRCQDRQHLAGHRLEQSVSRPAFRGDQRRPCVGAGWQAAAMAVHVHVAERTDALADGLASLLATPLADPFAREVVVVPARGVERWLTQRLSHRLGVGPRAGDGVCAGVDFVTPHSLVSMLLDKDADDPWDPERLAWPLLDVIDSVMGEPGFADLTTHLGGGDPRRRALDPSLRRGPAAGRPVRLLRHPATDPDHRLAGGSRHRRRPAASSSPTCAGRPSCGVGSLARMDSPPPDVRLATTLERLRSGGADLDLPPRLSLFGHTRLPETEVALLDALGALRDVHLWLPQASPSCGPRSRRRRARGRCRARPTTPPTWSGIPSSVRWGATRASCGARSATYPPHAPRARRRPRLPARLAAGRPAGQRGARRGDPVAPDPTRLLGADPRLPRVGAPGRRAARGARRAARRRPHARAARHPGDVPRHRGLRAADLRRLRARRHRRGARAPGPPAAGAAGRPLARRHQPVARRGRAARRAGARAPDRHPGPRPGRRRSGARPLRLR